MKLAIAAHPLLYLIGADADAIGAGRIGEIIEVPWDCDTVPPIGEAIGYCNLFDEKNSGHYPPYMRDRGTARQYKEGHIDPHGPGFDANALDQIERRKDAGFGYIELDNPDSYPLAANMHAIALAEGRGLKVIAKNPGLGCSDGDADQIVAHPNVHGIIVEKGAGTPMSMDAMRAKNGKPDLPVWFVFFTGSKSRALRTATACKHFENMYASYSPRGEYSTAILL